MIFRVGKGNTIRFWIDVWCSESALSHCLPHLFGMTVQRNSTVEEMWDQSSGQGSWNLNFLRDFNDWELDLVGDFLHILRGHKPHWRKTQSCGGKEEVVSSGLRKLIVCWRSLMTQAFPQEASGWQGCQLKLLFSRGRRRGGRCLLWIDFKEEDYNFQIVAFCVDVRKKV